MNNKNKSGRSFQDWLDILVEQMKNVHRWGDFNRHFKHQTTFDHVWQQLLITAIGIFLQFGKGVLKNAPFMLMVCALLHDGGEATENRKKGSKKRHYDFSARDKKHNKPRRGLSYEDKERKVIYAFFDKIPLPEPIRSEVINFLILAYELQYTSELFGHHPQLDVKFSNFFRLLEQLGYSFNAIRECQKKNLEYTEVFKDNHNNLLSSTTEFPAIKALYGPFVAEVEDYLKK